MSFSQWGTWRVFTPCPREDVPGWAPLVHPEGALYWVNEQEVSLSLHTRAPF